ncbi:pirin family protein [Clostridium kluyveri]|uniref:Pirin-related protein n=2 Tax=Clostridium kluyveri TaxID=1534 RepID=A5N014_CLOK5|nr:pirin family protein [Clostridium kluyveri]EDK34460.1 Pirin-related protein [Clostridium kluyveri DSM 555]
MSTRAIKKVIKGNIEKDGAGVKLVRILSIGTVKEFDPFLMLDIFDSTNPEDYTKGFPWHPHRGIDTVTYLINGKIEHKDSMGNIGVIEDGCCQWMTAGSGIIHQEMPQVFELMMGFQLWINLPRKNKMCSPKYRSIERKDIGEVKEQGCNIKVISGKYKDTSGDFDGGYVKANILEVKMEADSKWSFETKEYDTAFIYIFRGYGYFDGGMKNPIYEKSAALFENGDKIEVKSDKEKIHFILFTGKPLKEPVAWGGPIVMNSDDELTMAFKELDNGTFIK